MKLRLSILLFFSFLFFSNVNALEDYPFKNMTVHSEPIKYDNIVLLDKENKILNLNNLNSTIYIINFWTTWCAPCREEMPSLNQVNKMDGFDVYPVNLEGNNLKKVEKFYKKLNINNLPIYFDKDMYLVKLFSIRGVPTTIILNKERQEIARMVGNVDLTDKKFITWIKKHYN